jgi:hypothetical protein
MKNINAAVLAIAAFTLAPAYGQDGTGDKQCVKRCVELTPAESIKKIEYDYEAVESDAAMTAAEKKKSHKKAVAGVCARICTP